MSIHNEDGFTLAEMLVSLVIFSLSMAVIWQGAGLTSRLNAKLKIQKADAVALQKIEADLKARLSPLQPITDTELTGDRTHLSFQCEPKAPSQNCSFDAPLGHFVYLSEGARHPIWPPVKSEEVRESARLSALAIENDQGKSLAIIKFPVEHPADCQFDMISRVCRSETAVSEALP